MNEQQKLYVIESSNSETEDKFVSKCQNNNKPYYYLDKLFSAYIWKSYAGAERAMKKAVMDITELPLSITAITQVTLENAKIEHEEKGVIANINHLRQQVKNNLDTYSIRNLDYTEKLAKLQPGDIVDLREDMTEETKLLEAKVDSVSGLVIVVGGHKFSRMRGTCNDDDELMLGRIFPKNDESSRYLMDFFLVNNKGIRVKELSEDKISRIAAILRE